LTLIARWVRDGMTTDLEGDADALADAAWKALARNPRGERNG
jgi:hypothetical protein